MGNVNDEEKTVYEEWRTYPPVPNIEIKTSFSDEDSEDIQKSSQNISAVKIESDDR